MLCRKKGLQTREIAFAVNMSVRLVEECQRLIEEFAQRNASFERNVAVGLEDLLKDGKEDAT